MDNIWSSLAYSRRDLSNCESEPIQFCGAIQDAGWFLGFDSGDGSILAASKNCEELFGIPMTELLGRPLETLISSEDGTSARPEKQQLATHAISKNLKVISTQQTVHACFHESSGCICLDLEPVSSLPKKEPIEFVELLRKLVIQVDLENEIDPMLMRAADQVRAISGYDRVMVYRFEPNWDGYVIAESKRNDLEKFLGLYYPATDIPAQARRLYLESRYRMIVDSDSSPIPIETKKGLGRSELDLSGSNLRAVSPFHIQYMKNMGVRSSFSIPLKVHGQLWGLIVCHHYDSAKSIPHDLRLSCELAGQIVSGRLVDHINYRRLKIHNQILNLSQSILDRVTEGKSAIDSFRSHARELLNATESSGMHVRLGGDSFEFGSVPAKSYIDTLVAKLTLLKGSALWKSDNVNEATSLPIDESAIGAMAIPLSIGFEDCIIWFRSEFKHEVHWGGNPHGKAHPVETLSPRASFSSWTENVEGRSRQWSESSQESAQQILFTFIRDIFRKAVELSVANAELARVTRAKDEFIGLVSHELRTPLGVMIGWIDILQDEVSKTPSTNQALEIIQRNAKLQINLINDLLDVSRIISGKMRISMASDISIHDMIHGVISDLKPTAQSKGIELKSIIESPTITSVDPDRMQQIIWNLVSNAIKFTPKGGTVAVGLKKIFSSFQIYVMDNGVGIETDQLSRIFDRFAQVQEGITRSGGLGLGLSIVRALVELHGGRVIAHSDGKDKGSTFTATFPIFNLKTQKGETPAVIENIPSPTPLADLTILIVEDQSEAAEAMSILLKKLGASTEVAYNGTLALELLKSTKFDLIISDIGMPLMDGYQVIRKFRALEKERDAQITPAIALTAYATAKDRTLCLEAGFQNHIAKPVDRAELLAVIRSTIMHRSSEGNE